VGVGLICHLDNPTVADVRQLAEAAEEGGADWLGLPDAFWWRDVWLLLAEAGKGTQALSIGPVVTNPYLRHPFHTVSAAATLQGLVGDRVFVGVGAGGSEVTGAAGIARTDAAKRIEALATLIRAVSSGSPLDPSSGRAFEVPFARPPVLIAGRASDVLEVAGRCADRALLWSVPNSDLNRSVDLVRKGKDDRAGQGLAEEIDLVWAPMVDHDELSSSRLRRAAPYSVLNSRPEIQRSWGLDRQTVAAIRRAVVAGDSPGALKLVPAAVFEDLLLADARPTTVARTVREIGATSLAIPVFETSTVAQRVAWARAVLSEAAVGDVAGRSKTA
jgi:5,10-methylenetetrahydromethanopterin reductase